MMRRLVHIFNVCGVYVNVLVYVILYVCLHVCVRYLGQNSHWIH